MRGVSPAPRIFACHLLTEAGADHRLADQPSAYRVVRTAIGFMLSNAYFRVGTFVVAANVDVLDRASGS